MSVDLRTRSDGPPIEVDPVDVFERQLPAAFEEARDRLAPAIAASERRPMTIEVDGRAWILSVDRDLVRVEPAGPDTRPIWHVEPEQLNDLVADQATPIGWLASGALHTEGAGLSEVLDWWLLLRGALDGSTPHAPGAVTFTDIDGSPLDLGRSFEPDDPADEMAQFLHQAGFLHLRGVFGEDEMANVSDDMDRAAPEYEKGDGRSWWATLADGSDALVRMQRFDQHSDTVVGLLEDERLTRIGELTGDGHQLRRTANRIEALFKPLGVTEGISDIPWHKDCSLGRHSYECCTVTAGISVTGADADSGQLRVVAGSNRALVWPAPSLQPGLDLPVIPLPTRTGDVTLHLSCTLHMAQPPVTHERRVMYTSFMMEPLDLEAATKARLRLGAIREKAPVTVSQPAVG